jgi:sulfite reductase (NADPH) hemoprotein beta-component
MSSPNAAWIHAGRGEKRAGITLAPAKPYQFTTTADLLGWRKAVDGSWFLGLFVETGRVKDAGRKPRCARSRKNFRTSNSA